LTLHPFGSSDNTEFHSSAGRTSGMTRNGSVRHLLHVLPSFAPGGVQIRVSYLMNRMDLPLRHTIIAMDGDFSAGSRLEPHVQCDFTSPPRGGGLRSRVGAYRRVIRDLAPDLMMTYQWGSIEWALANRIAPVARHVHLESGFGVEEANTQIRRRVWMRRLALGRIEALVVPSRTLVEIATGQWRIDPTRVRYIPNGVDCAKYAAAPVADAVPGFAPRSGEKIVGTLTPLRPEKNLTRLLNAFAQVINKPGAGPARLLILGEGQERPHLEALVDTLGLGPLVLLPGHVEAPEGALGWLDLYAISSDTEQMPNAVNQAMAAGLAVVGLDVGDVRHIVSPDNKPFIVPRGNDAMFVSAMAELLGDDALRRRIGEANARHVREHYTLDAMLRAYRKIWGQPCES